MKYRVDLIFAPDQDFYHSSMLYTGLDLLSRRGSLDLRFRPAGEHDPLLTKDPLTVCLEVQAPGSERARLLAIDLHDQSDIFACDVLQQCDCYLKRSFYRPDLVRLPPELAGKIRPFGLNYPCRTWGSSLRLLQAGALRLLPRGLASVRRLRQFFASPNVRDFEQGPRSQIEPTIVFQTRVWEADETALGESEAINEGRVAIVRALKEAFGNRFRGGLVRTPLALARYPREVSHHSTRRSRYTAMSKRNLIGIYTRGLHGSTAFKLPEYLAASQCIVAEMPRNEARVPLEPEKHLLPFQSPEECVAACERLLCQPDLALNMRNANYEYYKSEVEPSSHISRILEQ